MPLQLLQCPVEREGEDRTICTTSSIVVYFRVLFRVPRRSRSCII